MKSADLKAKITQAFPILGGSEVNLTDSTYSLPSKEWLTGEFSRIVQSEFQTKGPSDDAWDCDDAALQAMVLARRANRQRGKQEGIAFGFVSGSLVGPLNGIQAGPHATNLVHCSDGNLYLYEPQNGQITLAADGFNLLPFLVLM